MEDEVIQTTVEPTSDVVETNVTSAATEPVIDPSQSAAVTQPVTPAPLTEKELAVQEINNRQIESYNTKGQGIKDWIATSYNYDATQAGTLWVAGKINDVNTQMSFLEATLNEDLYSEMDLQKYFFDTNLATARAYAKEKKHETAYGFYRAAQEKALAEGQLTGWYMPAEANYMLSQWIVADEQLKDQNISAVDRARAESVSRAVSGWFEANNITTRGIRCLNSLYLEETIRHNKELERLQEDANAIQKMINDSTNAANAANYELSLAKYRFQLAEEEKGMGFDLNDDGIIGHTGEDAQRFGYYTSEKDWAMNNISTAMSYWGSDRVRSVLGDDYKNAYNNYLSEIGGKNLEESVKNNGYLLDESYLNKETYTVVATEDSVKGYKDKHVYTFHVKENGEAVTKAYVKDNNGVFHQIETDSLKLTDGTTLKDKINNFSKSSIIYDNYEIQVGSIANNTAKEASVKNNWKNYDRFSNGPNNDTQNKFAKKIAEYEAKGYVWDSSKRTGAGFDIDAGIVMYNAEENKYISISDVTASVEEWDGDSSAIKEVTQPKWSVGSTFYEDGSGKYAYMKQNSETIGQGTTKHSDGTDVKTTAYMFVDGDGNAHYYKLGKENNDAYLTNYYTIISEDEARKINPNINKKLEDVNNYRSGINVKKQETIAGKNQETIAQEEENKSKQTSSKSASTTNTSTTGGVSTNNVTVKPVERSENTKQNSKATDLKNKSEEEQVLEDYDKYVTAFAEGEAVKQIKEIDEKLRQQLGATYL